MNTTVSKSFGLALLLAVGIIAVLVAMGAFTSQRAAADITGASIKAVPDTAGSVAAITITFTEDKELKKNDTITVKFPPGFTGFTEGKPAMVTVNGTAADGATSSAEATVMVTVAGRVLVMTLGDPDNTVKKFTSPNKIAFTIPVEAGITLPATADTKDGIAKVKVSTSKTTTAVDFDLDVATARKLAVSPSGAGAEATVTVSFTDSKDLDVGNTISIELAKFGVPSKISANSVRISGKTDLSNNLTDLEAVSETAEGVSVSGNTISISIPDMHEDGAANGLARTTETTVRIQQSAGITLPTAAGNYPAEITTSNIGAADAQTTNAIQIVRELSLSPTSGAKGTSVTASGKGWGSTGPVMLWIDDGADASGTPDNKLRDGLEVILAENVAVSGGAFSATFTADTGFSDTTTIQARDAAGNFLTAVSGRIFEVTGSLSLDKDSVKINETLEITLSDYNDGAVGAITIGGRPQTFMSGDDTVTSGKATFTIEVASDTPLGTQVVSVTAGMDPEPETKTATVTVAAVPMTVSPATAARGQEITVSATGFTATTQIKGKETAEPSGVNVGGIAVDDDSNNNPVWETVSDNNGNITISFPVPNGAGTGEVLITITDAQDRVGEARITIPAPTLTLSTSESRRNSRVTATGTGFVANDSILLNYDTGTRDRSVGTATTNSVGEWSVQFVVPADAKIGATHTVTAESSTKDNGDPVATKSADHKVPGATITLDPATAASGETIKITGSSFRGYSAVDILSIGGIGLSTVGIQTNAEGFFSANVTVPQLAPGTHNVLVDIGDEGISEQLVIPVDTTQTVEDVFFDLIANESLQTIWRYDFDTRTWTSYTTDPETSFANDLFEVESSDILNINVSSEQTFSHQKGSSLFEGWNLITLN